MQQRTYNLYICAICENQTRFCCAACKGPFYCSVEHQKMHWKMGHKLECSEQSALITDLQLQRQHLRPQAIRELPSKSGSCQRIQLLLQISSQIYQLTSKRLDFYEMIADKLLHPKHLLNRQDVAQARVQLLAIAAQLDDFNTKFPVYIIGDQQHSLKSIKEDIQRRTELLLALSELFFQVGDEVKSERLQLQRVETIESAEGEESLQAAQAYLQLGRFYAQLGYMKRALAALSRAGFLFGQLNEKEPQADCHFAAGLVLRQQQNLKKAKEELESALSLRRDHIGHKSLGVAQCLEALGQTLSEQGNLRSALARLEECYAIKKFLFKDARHQELVKTSTLLLSLFQKIRSSQRLPKMSDSELIRHLDMQIGGLALENEINSVFKAQIQSHFDVIAEKIPQHEAGRTTQRTRLDHQLKCNHSQELVLRRLNINKSLMSSLSVPQLQHLKKLNEELQQEPSEAEASALIENSQFLRSLSQVQLDVLRQLNSFREQPAANPWVGRRMIESQELQGFQGPSDEQATSRY